MEALLCPKLGVRHRARDHCSGADPWQSIVLGRVGGGEEWDCKSRVRAKEPGLEGAGPGEGLAGRALLRTTISCGFSPRALRQRLRPAGWRRAD